MSEFQIIAWLFFTLCSFLTGMMLGMIIDVRFKKQRIKGILNEQNKQKENKKKISEEIETDWERVTTLTGSHPDFNKELRKFHKGH